MISFEEARTFVLDRVQAAPPVPVPVDEALGLVLAEDVVAPEAVPPFPNTAMDGFAVRAADTVNAPAKLTVVGTLAAGAAPGTAVGHGEAIRIMTGAPMPPGADAVIMVELTDYDDTSGIVLVQQAVPVGNHIRPAGEDLERGSTVFTAGTTLTAGHLGVLASIGQMAPLVHPRPRVGVLSTGDELVDGPQPLQPGQIRDSNRHTLLALIARENCTGIDLGCAPDTEEAITAAIERGLEHCDAIVTSGGVSMGAFDYVKVVLDRIGDMRWMQIAIKPAKPLAFGTAGAAKKIPIFGLPGAAQDDGTSCAPVATASGASDRRRGHAAPSRRQGAFQPGDRRAPRRRPVSRAIGRWSGLAPAPGDGPRQCAGRPARR